MKWSMIGLLALGIVAAGCAAILVVSMQSSGSGNAVAATLVPTSPEPTEESVLVAARELAPMQVLTADDVGTRSVPIGAAPEGSFADPVQVIGRVVLAPMNEGQALLTRNFAGDGSGVHLARALEEGKRAVSVALTDRMGVEGLLYPGCYVDVLTSMRVKADENEMEQPVSITLLRSVLVLGVGNKTIVSPRHDDGGEGSVLDGGARPTVTLLVDPEQAEKLKLAMEEGSVSLALRNPTDSIPVTGKGTRLASLSPVFAPESAVPAGPPLEEEEEPEAVDPTAVPKVKEIVIVRGGVSETKSFVLTSSTGGR